MPIGISTLSSSYRTQHLPSIVNQNFRGNFHLINYKRRKQTSCDFATLIVFWYLTIKTIEIYSTLFRFFWVIFVNKNWKKSFKARLILFVTAVVMWLNQVLVAYSTISFSRAKRWLSWNSVRLINPNILKQNDSVVSRIFL